MNNDPKIRRMLDELIGKEGAYSNNPHDAGGETMWGITIAVARANGYEGPMSEMPRETAEKIYLRVYFINPGFDRVSLISPVLANKLFDTGVNMGVAVPGRFLQRALNVLNRTHGATPLFPDLVVDGSIGAKSIAALEAFMKNRGRVGEVVLLRMVNVQQGMRYIEIAETRPANEEFIFGWFAHRVE